ncbi:hypothetical protein [Methanospirillum sp.]|uniref:hypothetical protein n=1 Tax=Methanospirillum sp. TaxID=45200 RepID=UPI00359FAFF7
MIESAIRLHSRSSAPNGSAIPEIVRDLSSTPMIIRPPAVLAKGYDCLENIPGR